ncbi:plasmid mobilization relaxosome protein MobC [bacterium]|nr:MAG: plasmid mobilization relaxosome protein MobC [bacterium]
MKDREGKASKRRWNSERYPKMITARVTAAEHLAIVERAESARLSASRYLVRCGLGKRLPPMREHKIPSDNERRDLEFLMTELRKVGVNLNQLARRRNLARIVGGMGPSRSKVDQAASMVEGLVRLIRKRM